MLYGHIEQPRHRVDHVLRLRELQDETGGFAVFIPLRYQHDFVDSADGVIRNQLQSRTTMAAPADSLKTFAVSRLLLDNVPHLKCFWVMHGVSLAQLSLNFGADDLDGSVVEYKITHDADSYGTPTTMHREDLLNLIWDAGFRRSSATPGTRSSTSTTPRPASPSAAPSPSRSGPDRPTGPGNVGAEMAERSSTTTVPRRDAAGRVVGLPDLIAVALAYALVNVVGLVLIDGVVALLGLSRFGGSSGWLVLILPGLLFFDEVRAWRGFPVRFLVALVAAVVAVALGLVAAGLARGLPPLVSGGIGALVAVAVYVVIWFPAIRWLTGEHPTMESS
jgi:hypothetical protein